MSNYKKVKKQSDNPFLNLYKLDAVDREGKVFDYYFVSRRDEEHIKLKTKDNTPEGIVVYAAMKHLEDLFIWDRVLQMSQIAQSLEQFTLKKWSSSLKVPSAYRLCWQIRSR